MTDLASRLERLDLSQYLEAFENEGFDTWEVVLDITEVDLYDKLPCPLTMADQFEAMPWA